VVIETNKTIRHLYAVIENLLITGHAMALRMNILADPHATGLQIPQVLRDEAAQLVEGWQRAARAALRAEKGEDDARPDR